MEMMNAAMDNAKATQRSIYHKYVIARDGDDGLGLGGVG